MEILLLLNDGNLAVNCEFVCCQVARATKKQALVELEDHRQTMIAEKSAVAPRIITLSPKTAPMSLEELDQLVSMCALLDSGTSPDKYDTLCSLFMFAWNMRAMVDNAGPNRTSF